MKPEPTPRFEDASWLLPGTHSKLRIAGVVLAHFHQHRQTTRACPEAGGQLFARLLGGCVETGHATGPYPDDGRGRFWFKPNRRKQKADIREQFEAGLHYVGDWHTHPVQLPTPSAVDLASMKDCFNRSRHELDSFLMVIVGTRIDPQSLWLSLHSEKGHVQLAPDNESPGKKGD